MFGIETKSDRIVLMPNGSLLIQRVVKSDDGFYLCQVANGVSPDLSKVIQLTVNGESYQLFLCLLAKMKRLKVQLGRYFQRFKVLRVSIEFDRIHFQAFNNSSRFILGF